MYNRHLNLNHILAENNILLLGPRATGKSYLIKHTLKPKIMINLLRSDEYLRFSQNPALLHEMTAQLKAGDLVVIDEIQKIPTLLNDVHYIIEEKNIKFLLTGSSARKLRRGNANLLAGRAWTRELFPLTSNELGNSFEILKYLNQGGLPRSYDSSDYKSELQSYVGTYLQEEIHAESLSRNLPAFTKFLEVMALQSGEELYLQGIANDTGLKAKTVSNYIQILEDTLLGFTVPSFQQTKKRKAISRSKYYLFDVGITGHLTDRHIIGAKSVEFGHALEQFIAQELRAYLSYTKSRLPLQYWRSVSKHEVDFVIGNKIAIEVKSTSSVTKNDLSGLKALQEEGIVDQYLLISMDNIARFIDGIQLLPVHTFLEKLWNTDTEIIP